MPNPISVGGGYVELTEGTREWTLLSIDEKTQKKTIVKTINGEKKFEKSNEDEPILSFRFVTIDAELGEAFCRVRVRPKSAPNSDLVKLLKEMAPGKVTDDVINNADLIWRLAQSLVGKVFLMSTVGKNGFNNKQSIMPMPRTSQPVTSRPPQQQTVSQAKRAIQQQALMPQADEPPPFSDDDIPF